MSDETDKRSYRATRGAKYVEKKKMRLRAMAKAARKARKLGRKLGRK